MAAAPIRSPRGTAPARPDLAAGTAPATGLAPGAGLAREWPLPFTVDIPLTLAVHRRGPRDPAYATDAAGAVWRTSLTPEGPGTLRVALRRTPATGQARVPPGPALLPGSASLPGGTSGPGQPSGAGQPSGPGQAWVTGQAWGPGAGWLLDSLPGWLGFHDDRAGF